jgi:hypothetical protein
VIDPVIDPVRRRLSAGPGDECAGPKPPADRNVAPSTILLPFR